MSNTNRTLSPRPHPAPQPNPTAPESQRSCNTFVRDQNGIPPKSKMFASAVEKLWTAIRWPRNVLAKHLGGKRGLRKLMSGRAKKAAIPTEEAQSKPESTHDDNVTSSPRPSTMVVEEIPSEPLPLPEPRFAVTTATESSISLSSQPDATPTPTQAPTIDHPLSIIHDIDRQFRSDGRSSTPFSEASTLQNSTVVYDNLSRRASDVRPPATPESDSRPITTPPLPPQLTRPFTPRLQTNIDNLNVPSSDDEDSHSTVRGRGSPASAVDFNGIGRHFEESTSH